MFVPDTCQHSVMAGLCAGHLYHHRAGI